MADRDGYSRYDIMGRVLPRSAVRNLSADDQTIEKLVAAARDDKLTDDDIAELAARLADSGSKLPRDECAADVASTGGISSLSTLLCPLQLRVRGFRVPKLGVVGRPAGGVDVLQTVPGFNALLTPSAARDALARGGYVHLLADEQWAPLDARLFGYRQVTGTQALPPLVIGSLLAKKLAAGVVGVGLEVRVAPHGNFGVDFATARRNAHRYMRVARILGLRPVCALTDASEPYQPYIGRGEALLALWMAITGRADSWLAEHIDLCGQIAGAVSPPVTDHPSDNQTLASALSSLLQAHGTSWDAFETRALEIRDSPRIEVFAEGDGVVEYDLLQLRTILVQRQRDEAMPAQRAADPIGVVLHARPGQHVRGGHPLLSIRASPQEAELVHGITSCVGVVRSAQSRPPTWTTIEII